MCIWSCVRVHPTSDVHIYLQFVVSNIMKIYIIINFKLLKFVILGTISIIHLFGDAFFMHNYYLVDHIELNIRILFLIY